MKPTNLNNKLNKILFISILTLSSLITTSFSPAFLSYGVKTVVIDAGHGGKDPGCSGTGSNEKTVALSVALKLGKLISDNYKNVKVVYTRDSDKFIELHERANIANSNKADLFICIHCNSGNSAAFGAETYVMGLHKTKENLAVANRENQAILKEDNYKNKYDGFDPNSAESNIMFSMFQSAFLEQSLSFASKVQTQFRESVGRSDRGVKQAGFLVLYRTAMPSVLIETGFLTNQQDETFLATENGQSQMASAIFKAFKQYKKEIEHDNSPEISEEKKSNEISEKETKNTKNEKIKTQNNEKETNVTENNSKNSDPSKMKMIEGIVFRVQITSSNSPIKITPENFNGLDQVIHYRAGDLYRYLTGEEKTLEKIKIIQEITVEKGFKDAFIVAFKNGERISISDALKELKQ